MIRIGASGANGLSLLRSILSALKVLESAGVRIYTDSENPERLTRVHVPWHFPLKLSVKELSNFLLLPTGEAELPGTPGLHPKLTLPPLWYQNPKAGSRAERCFALSMDQPTPKRLSISPMDSLEHSVLLGPTGSGKSTILQHLERARDRPQAKPCAGCAGAHPAGEDGRGSSDRPLRPLSGGL